jgi:peptidyl-tRNA hydrolase ICT1
LDQLKITYDRSSGPGGQNVNKVNTKVDLRFNVNAATWISDKVKQRLMEDVRKNFNCRIFGFTFFNFQFKTKINSEGFLIIKSDVTRYQQMNLADALEKLRTMIRDAEKPKTIELSPEKLERIRKG